MGSNPLNLLIRFLLELTALIALGFWGWRNGEGAFRYALAIIIPVIIAAVWGTFAVPDDPSRSGSAPIAVAGYLRLAIELTVFCLAIWALYDTKFVKSSWIMGAVVAVHYMVSYDRIMWLINQ
ncbi:MAG: YrdB family protein [Candidatus Marinimicrobia bacterium]|jgi:hypothetical protein|nr:YrdB family protein [Candidatus Neomarinimicrobiota bacterium]MBT3634218.1 YrdB family protein [Candidatus Neomarinimicrobiota bacterium]MBT3682983.1 YrdB family protein [Candidatus Neomarinimicrobiota bacterium]MBT3760027.1 YrdB family protein [Candidatus Neomarinimicrobiota bacterium]MBT3896206.1 YrdB family protein [Candidatus Neomarinimicrobiota bacterium]